MTGNSEAMFGLPAKSAFGKVREASGFDASNLAQSPFFVHYTFRVGIAAWNQCPD